MMMGTAPGNSNTRMYQNTCDDELVGVRTPQKKWPVVVTLSKKGSPTAQTHTDEDYDGLLALKETTEGYSLSLFITNLEFRDGGDIFACRNISWRYAHVGCEFEFLLMEPEFSGRASASSRKSPRSPVSPSPDRLDRP